MQWKKFEKPKKKRGGGKKKRERAPDIAVFALFLLFLNHYDISWDSGKLYENLLIQNSEN